MSLSGIRNDIDAIDAKILSLLNRRFSLALRTRAFKSSTRDPVREREIRGRLKMKAAGFPLLRTEFVLSLYADIIKESRRLQSRSGRNVKQEKQP
jgi:chorismate mutase